MLSALGALCLWSADALVGEPLVAVGQIDDAAIGEAQFGEQVAHDDIVAVGVDAYVVGVLETVLEDGLEHALAALCAGDAMDDVVGSLLVGPLALVDGGIGRFGTGYEGEGGDGLTGVVEHHIAVAALDVALEGLFVGISVDPLVHVAAAPHGFPCVVGQAEQGGDVGCDGFPDGVVHVWSM